MALIVKCDRCGVIVGDRGFDGKGCGPFVWDSKMAPDQESFDLCENCYNSLCLWLMNPSFDEIMSKIKPCNKYEPQIEVEKKVCETCKYNGRDEHSPCIACYNYSKWEAKDGSN